MSVKKVPLLLFFILNIFMNLGCFQQGSQIDSGWNPTPLTPGVAIPASSAAALTHILYPRTILSLTLNTLMQSLTPTVSGGTASSFSVTPSLPAGITLNTSTGVISGTPTSTSSQTTYTVSAQNSSSTVVAIFEIEVLSAGIPPKNLNYSRDNVVFKKDEEINSLTPTVEGGEVTSYSITPSLPTGLSISTSTGIISGTPTANSGSTEYTVTASNGAGATTKKITLEVTNSGETPTSITYPNVISKTFQQNQPLSLPEPVITGGDVTSFTIDPTLPAGLSIDPETGVILGAPTGTFAPTIYTITASNENGDSVKTQIVLESTSSLSPPRNLDMAGRSKISLPVNVDMTAITPTIEGGEVASFSVSPALPQGLHLDATTGALAGKPIATQSAQTYTITATNNSGSTTTTLEITITASLVAPSNLSSNVQNLVLVNGQLMNVVRTTVEGGPVTSYSISPALPTGLYFDTTRGEISGIPTQNIGNTSFTITATNTAGNAQHNISIQVVSTASSPNNFTYSSADNNYSRNIKITTLTPSIQGGNVTSYSISPTLPTGLSFNPLTGVISGTPTVSSADQTYTITATNSGGTDTFAMTIEVKSSGGIQATGGDYQGDNAGNLLANPLIATILDTAGNAIEGEAVTWQVLTGGGTISNITPANNTTDSNGRTQINFTLGASAGSQTVKVTAPNVTGAPSVTFNLFAGTVLILNGGGGSTLDGVAITTCGGGDACNSTNPYTLSADTTFARVTMSNGAHLSGTAWSTGAPAIGNGFLQFTVGGTITICSNCSVTMTGKGFLGATTNGFQGHSASSAGAFLQAANVQSGGGARTIGGFDYGGGGGGHAAQGSDGGSFGGTPGGGGAAAGSADITTLTIGGGGGAGSDINPAGNGGGAIKLTAGNLTNQGTIVSNGVNGTDSAVNTRGCPGGGAGGSIFLAVNNILNNSGSITTNAGNGGNCSGTNSQSGGNGSVGRIRIDLNRPTQLNLAFGGTGTIGQEPYLFIPSNQTPELIIKGISFNYNSTATIKSISLTSGATLNMKNSVTTTGNVTIDNSTLITGPAQTFEGDVTLTTNSTIQGDAWSSGAPATDNGILDLFIGGTLNICSGCKITMDGKGFTGSTTTFFQGDSASGSGANLRTPNGQSGGGGTLFTQDTGGGGGGHATSGSDGSQCCGNQGQGGNAAGSADLSTLTIGGGGGSGPDVSGGGNGGGAIKVVAKSIVNAGTITAKGIDGTDRTQNNTGCPGGGAGGAIHLVINELFNNSGTVTTDKGAGGDCIGTTTHDGGDGSVGRVRVDLLNPRQLDLAFGGNGTFTETPYVFIPSGRVTNFVMKGNTIDLYAEAQITDLSLTNSANLTMNNSNTITANATIDNSTLNVIASQVINGDLTLTNNGTIVGKAWSSGTPAIGNGFLDLSLGGDLDISSNSSISMDGRGFLGSTTTFFQGQSASSTGANSRSPNGQSGGGGFFVSSQDTGGGGGGHATAGSAGETAVGSPGEGGAAGGTADLANLSIGGGGGSGPDTSGGGNGGGAIKISARNVTNAGNITAKGLNGTNRTQNNTGCPGGGAGGAIHLIIGGTLNHTGTITADKGAGGDCTGTTTRDGGDGSVGRMRIDLNNPSQLNLAFSSAGTFAPTPYVSFPSSQTPALITDNETLDIHTTASFSSLSIDNSTVTFHELTTVTGNATVDGSTVNFNKKATINGDLTLSNTATVQSDAWSSGTPATGNGILELVVGGTLTNCSDCKLFMEGRGFKGSTTAFFQGDSATGVGANLRTPNEQSGGGGGFVSSLDSGGGGGGHATAGTTGEGNAPGQGGNAAGDAEITNLTIGGGGGAGPDTVSGGNGGGAIKVTAASLVNSGTITVKGLDGTDKATNNSGCPGGGAGGSIHLIISGVLNQTGTITADKGDGGNCSGATAFSGGNGSIGRMRIDLNDPSQVNLAFGSGGTYTPTPYVSIPSDKTPDFTQTSGTIDLHSTAALNTLNVSGGATLIFHEKTTVTGNSTLNNGNLTLKKDSSFNGDLTLSNGASLTGDAWSSGAPALGNGFLEFTVGGTLTNCATCNITMAGKGFTGSTTGFFQGNSASGAGANLRTPNEQSGGGGGFVSSKDTGGGGGGHANTGTDGQTVVGFAGQGGNTAGTADLSPLTIGGGGGSGPDVTGGGNGGGAIKINAVNLTNPGTITANGLNGTASATNNNGCPGGGAGGAIFINLTGSINNTGTLTADKGSGGNCSGTNSFSGGDGSVGRVRLEFTTEDNLGTITPAVGYCNGQAGVCP